MFPVSNSIVTGPARTASEDSEESDMLGNQSNKVIFKHIRQFDFNGLWRKSHHDFAELLDMRDADDLDVIPRVREIVAGMFKRG